MPPFCRIIRAWPAMSLACSIWKTISIVWWISVSIILGRYAAFSVLRRVGTYASSAT